METHSHGGAFQVVQVCVRHDAVFIGGPLQQQRLLDERRSATITTQSLANAGLVLVPFGKRRRLGSIACGVVEAGAAGTGTCAAAGSRGNGRNSSSQGGGGGGGGGDGGRGAFGSVEWISIAAAQPIMLAMAGCFDRSIARLR